MLDERAERTKKILLDFYKAVLLLATALCPEQKKPRCVIVAEISIALYAIPYLALPSYSIHPSRKISFPLPPELLNPLESEDKFPLPESLKPPESEDKPPYRISISNDCDLKDAPASPYSKYDTLR